MTEVFMCRPCAEKLKATGKVIMHGSVKDKSICNECNHSKYLYRCERINKNETNHT